MTKNDTKHITVTDEDLYKLGKDSYNSAMLADPRRYDSIEKLARSDDPRKLHALMREMDEAADAYEAKLTELEEMGDREPTPMEMLEFMRVRRHAFALSHILNLYFKEVGDGSV